MGLPTTSIITGMALPVNRTKSQIAASAFRTTGVSFHRTLLWLEAHVQDAPPRIGCCASHPHQELHGGLVQREASVVAKVGFVRVGSVLAWLTLPGRYTDQPQSSVLATAWQNLLAHCGSWNHVANSGVSVETRQTRFKRGCDGARWDAAMLRYMGRKLFTL